MSLYQLHRCVWDGLRAAEVSSGRQARFDPDDYELTPDEREAYERRDVARLYQLGLHPVLLNGFCRAAGLTREQYRDVLRPLAGAQKGDAPWRR